MNPNPTPIDPTLIDKIYNAFDPFEPLKPGNPAYVECGKVRGDSIITTK